VYINVIPTPFLLKKQQKTNVIKYLRTQISLFHYLFQVEPISDAELHRQPFPVAIETMETTMKTQGQQQLYHKIVSFVPNVGTDISFLFCFKK
jgi:hypothetical protein